MSKLQLLLFISRKCLANLNKIALISFELKISGRKNAWSDKCPDIDNKGGGRSKYFAYLGIGSELKFTSKDVSTAPISEYHTDIQTHSHHEKMPLDPHPFLLPQRLLLFRFQLFMEINIFLQLDEVICFCLVRWAINWAKARHYYEKGRYRNVDFEEEAFPNFCPIWGDNDWVIALIAWEDTAK